MAVYYIALLLILGLAYPLCIRKPTNIKKIAYLSITFGFLWLIATFRQGIGYDYYSYIEIFENSRQMGSLADLWRMGKGYIGFTALNKLLSLFIHDHTVMYGVYELLILVPAAWFIYRYCETVWLSTWLFVTLTFFYTSMNFIRQSLACSIILLGYHFLRDRKPILLGEQDSIGALLLRSIPFVLVVLAAATFHITALILIPVYFVCHYRLNKYLAIAYAGATLLLFLFSAVIVDLVTNYIFVGYKGTVWLTEGFPLIFLVVPFLLFGACLALKPVWEKRDPHATMLLNMMLYSTIIWLFITRHFILERFSMYTYIFVLVAIPSAISSLRASPEDHAQLEALSAKASSHKPSKEQHAKLRALSQKISDHEKYYWCAAAAVVLITLIYNEFGLHVNKFHGVVPYNSIFDWL